MQDKTAKPLGLSLRGTSFQLHSVIVKDLGAAYGGRSDSGVWLGQLAQAEAQARAHARRAEKDAQFPARGKAINGQRVDVTPELVKAIGRAVYTSALQRDDRTREDQEAVRALMKPADAANPPLKLLLGPFEPAQLRVLNVAEGLP